MNIIVLLCSSGLGKTGGAFFVLKVCLTFVFTDKSIYMAYLRKIYPLILSLLLILLSNTSLVGQTKPIKRLPSLPTNIPPPPHQVSGEVLKTENFRSLVQNIILRISNHSYTKD